MRLIDNVWRDDGPFGSIARTALIPFEGLYRVAVAVRSEMFDRGILDVRDAPIPVISVGNLTVGGTGKTPVSAWLATQLVEKGMRPAIVMRGYGGDEPLVHRRINPAVAIIVSPDRVHGIAQAARAGSDVAILDDAFQHRRARRDADIVLISADEWTGNQRLLPAGPYREPFASIRRATLVVITRKVAGNHAVDAALRSVSHEAPDANTAVVQISPSELISAVSETVRRPLTDLLGAAILAISSIANPRAFVRQLETEGALVTPRMFPDHHRFSASDVLALETAAKSCDYAVCTLKDVVKLGPVWPANAAPLWYVSQRISVESGQKAIEELLTRFSTETPLQSG